MSVSVEVRRRQGSSFLPSPKIAQILRSWIQENTNQLRVGSDLKGWDTSSVLEQSVEKVWVAEACKVSPLYFLSLIIDILVEHPKEKLSRRMKRILGYTFTVHRQQMSLKNLQRL